MARMPINRFWRCAELPFAESRCANDSQACYAPHAHAALSIGAVDGGSSVLTRGRRQQRLVRGDVVLIPPDEVHCCNPENDGRWSYQMLYLESAWLNALVAESTDEYGCAATTAGSFADTLAASVHGRLSRLNALLFGEASLQDKEAALVLFVGDVFACGARSAEAMPPPGAAPPDRLRRVREAIAERCAETLRLDELAAIAGMSRYHLLRTFRAAYGITPHAWQIDRRIERSRRLLDQGMSLADTALCLGFADQSHFQRAFKQRVAATPGEYSHGAARPGAISFKT